MANLLDKIFRKKSPSPAPRSFEQQTYTFEKFLKDAPEADFPEPRSGKPCAILVTPWLETAVPWFALTLALLYRQQGHAVSLIYQDLPFPSRSELPYQMEFIERILKKFENRFEIIRVSELEAQPSDIAMDGPLDELAGVIADTYLQRVPQGLTRDELKEQTRTAFVETANRVAPFFASGKFDHWVAPGGLYGYSGVYRLLGNRHGARVAFYDSGTGTLVLGTDDVAGHCMDLAKAFSPRFSSFLAENRETMVELARAELAKRLLGSDRYSYQKIAAQFGEITDGSDVLIPLSIFDDAAGIGKVQCFDDAAEWLKETVRFLLEETTASVVIREHPSARKVKTNRETQLHLAELYKEHPRFRFIAGTDDVSTYGLLKMARVILPCASTVGVEAAALGKQVVMESSAYYAKLGFVRRAQTREEYFAEVRRALENVEPLADELRDRAWICYFMGQVANFIDCDFTPIPEDFEKWTKWSLSELAAKPETEMVLEVLAENTPSCIVQGRHLLRERKFDLDEARTLAQKMELFFS